MSRIKPADFVIDRSHTRPVWRVRLCALAVSVPGGFLLYGLAVWFGG